MKSGPRPLWIDGLLVAGSAILGFLPGIFGEFLSWDDDRNFLHNPDYRGLGRRQIRWAFTTFHMGHWKPLTWLSLGLDYSLWGLNPVGYHLTNLLLHAGNALLVLLVARRLLELAVGPRVGAAACRLGAAGAALLFAVHPLRTESVVWITERRDVLSALFYLAAVWAYLAAVAPTLDGHPRRRGAYIASIVLFAAGLLSKSMVVTLPAALLILDVYPLRRIGGASGWSWGHARRLVVEKVPHLVLAAAASAVAFVALGTVHNAPTLAEMGPLPRLLVSGFGLAFYLWKTVWPVGLFHLYEPPLPIDPWAVPFMASGAAVAALAAAAWGLRRRLPGFAAAAAYYVVTLSPVVGIFQNGPQIAADRYTYLSCLGWAVLAGGGLALVQAEVRPGRPRLGGAALIVGAIVAVTLVALSARQSLVWSDSFTLWGHALAQDPGNRRAHTAYGALLLAHGQPARAASHFEEAVRREPELAEAVMGLAVVWSWTDRLPEAVLFARRAAALRPFDPGIVYHLGEVLRLAGDREGALAAFQQAERGASGSPGTHFAVATLLAELGRREEAVVALEEGSRLALAVTPGDPDVDRYTALVYRNWDPVRASAAWRRYLARLSSVTAPTAFQAGRIMEARDSLADLEPKAGVGTSTR